MSFQQKTNFQYCLPDCEETLYSAKVSAAPLHKCDFRTIQVNPLCNLAMTEDDNDEMTTGKPPMWGAQVIEQYRKVKMVPRLIGKDEIETTVQSFQRIERCRTQLRKYHGQ